MPHRLLLQVQVSRRAVLAELLPNVFLPQLMAAASSRPFDVAAASSRPFVVTWYGDALTIRLSAPLLALLCAGLAGWLVLFACSRRRRKPRRHPDDVEVVALFSNPRIPRRLGQAFKPLSFGQDLKFLMRTLPRGELAVEPAVSLYTARRALVQHRPRVLVFSGHTIGEDGDNVALETPDGAFDMVAAADPDIFIALLTSLARPGATPAVQLERLDRHLNEQQAVALEMPHCARGWMQRAAEERALATRPPGILPTTTACCLLPSCLLPATYLLQTNHYYHHLPPSRNAVVRERGGGWLPRVVAGAQSAVWRATEWLPHRAHRPPHPSRAGRGAAARGGLTRALTPAPTLALTPALTLALALAIALQSPSLQPGPAARGGSLLEYSHRGRGGAHLGRRLLRSLLPPRAAGRQAQPHNPEL